MFPLFETIAIENGKIKNIALHQARYEPYHLLWKKCDHFF